MDRSIQVREEEADDTAFISEVITAAFETMEFGDHTEQFIVDALRKARALTISLVAVVDGRLVGHIAFSPVNMSDGTQGWYGLGPVSVHPDFQREGIGKALVKEGLSRLRNLKASGCCLVGHPEYYRQFGFENIESLIYEGVPRDVFFVLSFDGKFPTGKVIFHEAFNAVS